MIIIHIVRSDKEMDMVGKFIMKTKNCEHKIAFINEDEFKKSKEKLERILNEIGNEEKGKIEILGCDLDRLAEEIMKENSKVTVW